MKQRPTRLAVAPLGLLLFAGFGARADETSPEWQELITPVRQLEIGIAVAEGATPMFGNLSGVDSDGVHWLAQFDLANLQPATETQRWRLQGRQLGLDTAELSGEYGVAGRYRLNFALDRLSHALTEQYHSPFLGAGSRMLILAPGLAQASANPLLGADLLAGQMRPMDLTTQRQRASLGGRVWLSPDWEWRTEFRTDRQSGTRPSGATLGTGGSSIAMILPEPVDSLTRRIDTSLAYQQPGRHLQLAYRGSFFNNGVDGYSFQSPFAIANTLLDNRMGSAPDNQAHQFSLNGGYSFGQQARLTLSASHARLIQDADFAAYSTAGDPADLPRDSLDGEVVTRQFQVKLASRPARDLRLNAAYRYDSRDNRTPVSEYVLPGVSSAGLGEVGAAGYTVSNTPYSRRQRNAQVEAGYRLAGAGDVSLLAQQEATERYCHGHADCVEVPESREATWRVEWRGDFAPGISGQLGLTDAERDGDDYRRFVDSIELAGMRKFFLADRQRRSVRAGVHADLGEAWSLGVALQSHRDRYAESPYGLQAARSQAVNLDLGYVVNDTLSLSLFATRERFRSQLAGSYANTQSAPGVTAELPGAQWHVAMADDVDSLGASLKHTGGFSGRLELTADLALTRAVSPYRVDAGPYSASAAPAALVPEALPEVDSRSLELRLAAAIGLDAQATLRLEYLYRRLRNSDFALDLYATENLTRLLGTEQQAPRHSAHLLGISYQYRFR